MCFVLGLAPAQIGVLRATPSSATNVVMAAQDLDDGDINPLGALQEALELEKSWHILHYLFTGTSDDTSSPGGSLLDGEELGEDLGYGPARLLGEKQTAAFAHFLENLDLASVQARIDCVEMANLEIYAVPMGAASGGSCEDEVREEVAFYFPRLRDYVVQVVQKRGGLLTWLS